MTVFFVRVALTLCRLFFFLPFFFLFYIMNEVLWRRRKWNISQPRYISRSRSTGSEQHFFFSPFAYIL